MKKVVVRVFLSTNWLYQRLQLGDLISARHMVLAAANCPERSCQLIEWPIPLDMHLHKFVHILHDACSGKVGMVLSLLPHDTHLERMCSCEKLLSNLVQIVTKP
jgi:hypothetical protein